jgi:hypothetical protein
MGQRLGIIAGAGEFPRQAIADARREGYHCIVAGIRGAAEESLKREADAFAWIGPAEIGRLVTFFKAQDVREAVLLGKVEHRTIFRPDLQEPDVAALLNVLPDRTPTTLLRSLIAYLGTQGITVKDPSFLLRAYFCPPGVLGRTEPSAAVLADIAFGWPLARQLADLDIGQTLVVKDRAVAGVESLEGTNETIARSGRLAGPGVVVLKVGRTGQDMRLDVPAVGLETLRALVRVRAAALAFEAATMPFFQKDEALTMAEANGIAVIAR